MPQPEKVRIRLQALDERLARLRMEKNRLIARVSQAERKRDTRRKIPISGAVLAAVDHEGGACNAIGRRAHALSRSSINTHERL